MGNTMLPKQVLYWYHIKTQRNQQKSLTVAWYATKKCHQQHECWTITTKTLYEWALTKANMIQANKKKRNTNRAKRMKTMIIVVKNNNNNNNNN